MKPDDFEKRLQSQPLRKIPTEWRDGILKSARQSAPSAPDPRPSILATLLWPNPKAWAGLAAVWVVVFALQLSSRGSAQVAKTVAAPQSSRFLTSLKDRQQTLVELIGNNPPNDLDKPRKTNPQPRSELRSQFLPA